MTVDEYKNLFEKDDSGCYINLVIPKYKDKPQLNLIGRKQEELSIDEIIRVKQYSGFLFDSIEREDRK